MEDNMRVVQPTEPSACSSRRPVCAGRVGRLELCTEESLHLPNLRPVSIDEGDPETRALFQSFETLLSRIDDPDRQDAACRAWESAATWCLLAPLYVPPASDAGADTDSAA